MFSCQVVCGRADRKLPDERVRYTYEANEVSGSQAIDWLDASTANAVRVTTAQSIGIRTRFLRRLLRGAAAIAAALPSGGRCG